MSFYSKYQELSLQDNSLLAWLEFNGDILDSGPNSNEPVHLYSSGGFIQSDHVNFDSDVLDFQNVGDISDFTLFLDFEKNNNLDSQIILSNYDGGEGFFFGCASSGKFFVGYELGGSDYLFFFDKIDTSKRAIILFKKSSNFFSLGYYEPFSKTIDYQSLVLPVQINDSTLKLGGQSVSSVAQDQNFKLFEFAFVNGSFPSFVEIQLCESMIYSYNDDFKYSWVSVKDKISESKIENVSGNTLLNTSIELPYCSFPSGYSFFGYSPDSNSRFYKNGEFVEVEIDSVVKPESFTYTDRIYADFFDSGVSSGSFVSFTGSQTGIFPKNSLCCYSNDLRIFQNIDYVYISEINPCYGSNIIFSDNSLLEI
jgi:hypothetical protein